MKTDDYGYEFDRTRAMRYAYRHGFFWLPCPICGFEYGGHESEGSPHIAIKGRVGIFQGVCRRHPDAEREFIYIPAHAEPLSVDVVPKDSSV